MVLFYILAIKKQRVVVVYIETMIAAPSSCLLYKMGMYFFGPES